MKTLNLNLRARVILSLIVGAQQGTVADIVSLSRVLGQIELSPEEREAVQFKELSPGAFLWDPEAQADKTVSLEDADAARLLRAVETWPEFTVALDAVWAQRVIDALKPEEKQK